MATVIDALVVTLGLDPTNFTKGNKESEASLKKLKHQSGKTTKDMELSGKRVAEGFSKIRNEVLGVATAFMAAKGITSFIGDVTRSDAAVGRLSAALGISIETLSSWEGVARKFGSSNEDIDNAFRTTQKLVEQLKFGVAPEALTRWLPQAGVDMGKFLNAATPLPEKLKMIQQALARATPGDAQFLGQQAGYSENTINMLRETAGQIEVLLDRQRKLNSVNDEDLRLAKERTVAWEELKDRGEALGRRILNRLSPAVMKIVEDMGAWSDSNQTFMDQNIDSTVDGVATAISDLGTIAGPILKLVAEGWKNIFGWIHSASTEIKEYNEVAKTKEKKGIKDDNPLKTATIHAMAWWGNPAAKEYLRQEREKLGLKPPGDADRIHLMPRSSVLADSAFAKLLSRGEGGYNSVNTGQKGGYKASTANLDAMTVAQVMSAQKAGQFNAAGRYQVIKETLADAVKALGMSGNEKFNKTTQDKIFEQYLVMGKQKDIWNYISGKSNNMIAALSAWSKEWASAVDPKTGKSRYAGIANNHASMTLDEEIRALQSTRARIMGGNNSKTDVKINTIQINTAATNAKEIAGTIGPSVQKFAFASNANNGLQ